jgi:cytochrome c peroxidase
MRSRLTGKVHVEASWTAATTIAAVAWFGLIATGATGNTENTGMANPVVLVNAYDRFAASAAANVVSLSLSNLRGFSSEAVNAGGQVTIDLATGKVDSRLQLLSPDGTFDLWLADNQPGPGRTTFAEQGDRLTKVGTYAGESGRHTLSATLGADTFTRFFPDRAFVVRTGESPVAGFVLTGPSTLFARLQHRQVRFTDNPTVRLGLNPAATSTRVVNLARLIAQGRQLFLHETFNGNGRTCGTCHVEANNFTIDPKHIGSVPASDPLFVAETNPALASLENSQLLRRFGLFLVNADGFDPSRGFVLRSAQNVQALANSMARPNPILGVDFSTNGRNPDPPERLGWGNDGPPLRDFALVAIAQHAPMTMNRTPGADFRVPTDEELDALAAYQLSLGRQEDFDLRALDLKVVLASSGKTLFLDSGNLFEPGHKNCNACHFNGGGTTGTSFNPAIPGFPRVDGSPRGFNIASPTGANDIPLALELGLPRDGGFGQIPTVFGSFGNTDDLPDPFGHVEIEEFNSPPLVESADTSPFFHNHTEATVEGAVAFYGTQAFKNSLIPAVIAVEISEDPDDPEVQAIAAFLRVLNALENIRSSIDVATRARMTPRVGDLRDLARLAQAETEDALEVISAGALARETEAPVRSARVRLLTARVALEVAAHLRSARTIDYLLSAALQQLRGAREALANPATLPASFRN